MFENSIKNKTILITGGSNGVGKDVAIKAAKLGAKIIIGDIDAGKGKKIVSEINRNKGNALFIKCDLRKSSDCDNLFKLAIEKYGQIDNFLGYAGVTDAGSLLDTEPHLIDKLFDVNIKSTIMCSKFAVEAMRKKDGGSIVLIGSPHAWIGEEDRVAYACSKASILTLSSHISKHNAQFGIRSNVITMGWTPTEGELELRKKQNISEKKLREIASKILPSKNMTEVSDITSSILFLFSDESKMVSGSNFRITGGWYI